MPGLQVLRIAYTFTVSHHVTCVVWIIVRISTAQRERGSPKLTGAMNRRSPGNASTHICYICMNKWQNCLLRECLTGDLN